MRKKARDIEKARECARECEREIGRDRERARARARERERERDLPLSNHVFRAALHNPESQQEQKVLN